MIHPPIQALKEEGINSILDNLSMKPTKIDYLKYTIKKKKKEKVPLGTCLHVHAFQSFLVWKDDLNMHIQDEEQDKQISQEFNLYRMSPDFISYIMGTLFQKGLPPNVDHIK